MSYKTKVTGAIASLKERSGSSLQAIKKALGAAPNQWRFINAALKSGTASGLYTKNGGKYKNVKQAAPKKKKAKKKKVVKKKKKKAKKKKVTKKKEKENQEKESHQKESYQKESRQKKESDQKKESQKKDQRQKKVSVSPRKHVTLVK